MKSCRKSVIARHYILLMALGIIALMASCFEDECDRVCNEGNGDEARRTDPDELMNFLVDAYESEDIDAYGEALSDYFEFVFTEDVADSLGLPEHTPWWGKVEDLQSTLKMFDDPSVASIEMTLQPLSPSSAWASCGRWFFVGDPPESTFVSGLCNSLEPDIKVHVEEAVEPRIIWVHKTYLDIMVKPDPESDGDWVVLRIKERLKPTLTTPLAATEASTWGSIKAGFKE